MKSKTWIVDTAATVLLALAAAWAFAPKPEQVELSAVTQGLFETTIDDDDKTRLTDRYVVSAPLVGRLARITLKEGDAETVDMPLAQQGFIAKAKVDADRLSTMAAQRELEAAAAERRMATHELEQTQAAMSAGTNLGPGKGSFTVRAPFASRVLRVLQTSESTAALGTPLIKIGYASHGNRCRVADDRRAGGSAGQPRNGQALGRRDRA